MNQIDNKINNLKKEKKTIMKNYISDMKKSQSSTQFVTIKTQKSITSQIQKQKQRKPSCWDSMINGIIRPPKAQYDKQKLGGHIIQLSNNVYTRQDVTLIHDQKILQLTLYIADQRAQHRIPYIILYMHGNSSSKLQATSLIKTIPKGISLAAFDFMGCGKNSQTQYISLGIRQAQQSKTVAKYLVSRKFKVILWGRSMGAATALLYGQSQFIVADSSFKSFKSLCKQVAKKNSCVPNCMISCLFPCVFTKIKWDVQKKAKYDVQDLNVKQALKKLNPTTTIIFMTGNNDDLVNKRNSQKLLQFCPCQTKQLIIFQGGHNSKRPQKIIQIVMDKIQKFVISKQFIKQQMKSSSALTAEQP